MSTPPTESRNDRFKRNVQRVWYFFPLQLLWLHLKRNHFLMIFWLLLFGFTLEWFANKYGVPALFLYPEYLNEISFWSYSALGFAFGGFVMAFNIYTYILHAWRFPFLATLSRPFMKFCVNNFLIPLVFFVTYLICTIRFQRETELLSTAQIVENIAGLFFGSLLFVVVSLLYFFRTNKDIYKITGLSQADFERKLKKARARARNRAGYYFTRSKARKFRIDTYLASPWELRLARDSEHYDRETLRRVFAQNHINATLFEIVVIASFLIIGNLGDSPAFVIPAAASACLLFTIIIMVVSIVNNILKGWTVTGLLILFILLNAGSSRTGVLNLRNEAYGLNYDRTPVEYNTYTLLNQSLRRDIFEADTARARQSLDRWLSRTQAMTGMQRPPLFVLNTSGGGLRSATWTVRVLQYTDSLLQGRLMRHTTLMTGSSGGLIGAAYVRELMVHGDTLNIPHHHHPVSVSHMGRDVLNPILFSIATNDLFIRYQKVEYNGRSYTKDRAYSFERQLNRNLNKLLNKPLQEWAAYEDRADVPLLVMAPAVVNDGRRMVISAQPASYLAHIEPNVPPGVQPLAENVDFNRLFQRHGADSLTLLTALRMSATFPYILPNVALPTSPSIEVMDAGLRDNFGIKSTVQYLTIFEKWIAQHTSGVVFIQLRDKEKYFQTEEADNSLADRLTNPIGSFYGNFFREQDYNLDEMIQHMARWYPVPLEVVTFELNRKEEDRQISMSWHLTELEKQQIMSAVHLPQNQRAVSQLARYTGVDLTPTQ